MLKRNEFFERRVLSAGVKELLGIRKFASFKNKHSFCKANIFTLRNMQILNVEVEFCVGSEILEMPLRILQSKIHTKSLLIN
jgi:hypothetical protein